MSMINKVGRRSVLQGTMAMVAVAAVPRKARAARSLRVMTWEGYADERWVKTFEEKTGSTVTLSYIGSVDELSAKMAASNGSDFDIVTPDISSFPRFIGQKLLQPIDLTKIPSISNVLGPFKNLDQLQSDGATYGVPFTWGSLPLLYRTDAFATAPDSWEVFWDPEQKGRVLIQDDANNNVTWAAIALGFENPYKLNDEQFEAVKQKLIALKNNALTFYTGLDDGASIFVQDGVNLLFPMGQAQGALIKSRGVDVKEIVPKQGAAGWIDCWGISAGAQDVGLAHEWIDAMLDREIGKYQSEKYSVASVVNEEANSAIGMTYADKLIWMQAPEDYARRVQVWNEVKASL